MGGLGGHSTRRAPRNQLCLVKSPPPPPPARPRCLPLPRENGYFGEIVMLSSCSVGCAGTARSRTGCPILALSHPCSVPQHQGQPKIRAQGLPQHQPAVAVALSPLSLSHSFHTGLSELPYQHHDLCWSQIRGWSRSDLFDFC